MSLVTIECPRVFFTLEEDEGQRTYTFGGTSPTAGDIQIHVVPDITSTMCSRWICGNVFEEGHEGCTEKQYYPYYMIDGRAITSPRQMSRLIFLYSRTRPVTNEAVLLYEEVSSLEDDFAGITYSPSLCLGPKLLLDFESLVTYKQHVMGFSATGWGCRMDPDPLCLMLSCLSVFQEFRDTYIEFLTTNSGAVMPVCTPVFCKFIPDNNNPTMDVCMGAGLLLFLSLYKTSGREQWAAFQSARLDGIKGALNATEGFSVNLTQTNVEGLTARITKIPGLLSFVWNFLINCPTLPVEIKNYLKILMSYKGMSSFKIVYDFLHEPISLAHLIYIDVEEVKYFRKVSNELIEQFPNDLPYLSLFSPDKVPPSSMYKKLASLAIQTKRLSIKTLDQLRTKSEFTFDNLDMYYRYKVAPGQNFDELTTFFGVPDERAQEIKVILEQLGRPVAQIPAVPQIMAR
ncbi:MAG: hypothetical protein FCPXV1_gp1 [Hangzhou cletus punctiger xinmovirus 1]|uniref:Uncharacterized protein n=1 Tax=Hangzhou cletus punctiger xinmovirus 1 TaxID=2905556 RepID=A0A8K1XC94_9MONO|nr:MAG: hypothetical protein FCPXV1_gp1 [Hangzhou cletus punctiger xinmovirus 1]